jgi:5-methylcytosine-specific restriction endonuclease McrA
MATEPLHATKACTKCGIEKPHDRGHFVLKLGKLTPLCRDCNKAVSRAYFERHRERMLAGFREARAADPEFHRERQRRYYRESPNPEARKAADKRYREANKDKRRDAHRHWSAANPDKIAAYGRAYSQTPEGRESQRQRSSRHREVHAERLKARRRELYDPERTRVYGQRWYLKDPERAKALGRAWYHRNKAKIKEWDHRRREANGSGIAFTSEDVERIYAEQGGSCSYCAAVVSERYEIDHFIPIARGGGHEPENIVIACMPCNRSKGAKLPWVWRPDLFRHPSD